MLQKLEIMTTITYSESIYYYNIQVITGFISRGFL